MLTARDPRQDPAERPSAAQLRWGLSGPEWRGTLVVAAVALASPVLVLVARAVFGVLPHDLYMDPSVVADYPDYVGSMSHLGIVGWVTAAACALLSASLASRADPRRALLLGFGLFTAVMALDDLFRGHEQLGPLLTGGDDVGSNLLVGALGLLAVGLAVRHRHAILHSTPLLPFAAAALFFAVSVAADVFLDRPHLAVRGQVLLEDGAKFIGVLFWAWYLVVTGRRSVRADQTRSSATTTSTSRG